MLRTDISKSTTRVSTCGMAPQESMLALVQGRNISVIILRTCQRCGLTITTQCSTQTTDYIINPKLLCDMHMVTPYYSDVYEG